ncbi:hypothetical protein GCM10010406_46360 [Streptomyces thermolineatus]|uniref:FxLD family lantipeptide n=1 Tax=Streptomyces thermolineatus TaxID=44033 RepID=A0ABP6A1C0_9ACTN
MTNAVAITESTTDTDPFAATIKVATEIGADLLPQACGSNDGCGASCNSSCTSSI